MVAAAVGPGAGLVAAAAAGGAAGGPLSAVTLATSTNWAGYVAANSGATTHSVSFVSGAWVEPSVTCTGVSGNEYAVFWVGIDGAFSPSTTVEQVGTLAQCAGTHASYSAWWELYPTNAIQPISSITVHAGDSITASVKWNSGNSFTMKITDGAHSFSKTASQTAVRNSAECIAERPSNGVSLYRLADFHSVRFSSCTAKIGTLSGPIGGFATVYEINMVRSTSSPVVLAQTGALSGKKAFTVTWKHSS